MPVAAGACVGRPDVWSAVRGSPEALQHFEHGVDHGAGVDAARANHPALAAQHALLKGLADGVVLAAADQVLHLSQAEGGELPGGAGGGAAAAADAEQGGALAGDDLVAQGGVDLVEVDGPGRVDGKSEIHRSGVVCKRCCGSPGCREPMCGGSGGVAVSAVARPGCGAGRMFAAGRLAVAVRWLKGGPVYGSKAGAERWSEPRFVLWSEL